jgi:alpha-beta hydrolase superfamily lysophospholipase
MSVIFEDLKYPSANGKDTIVASVWRDDAAQPVGIMQIVHGMNEYMGRYDGFARFLAERGYIVCGNDHVGHGRSKGADGYGYFADKDGEKVLIDDTRRMNEIITGKYPGLKVVMLGHSMGSFICREYITKYGEELAGIIISGTAGPNPSLGVASFLSRMIMIFCGPKHPSPMMCNLAFGKYNDRYPEKRTKYDWISRDTAVVDKYAHDEMCTYYFTAGGYHDLLKLIKSISSPDWAQKIPKDRPYLVFSGSMDPVGDYTKGVQAVCDSMKAAGVKDMTVHFYEGGHHEMLNDIERDKVYADVIGWADKAVGANRNA